VVVPYWNTAETLAPRARRKPASRALVDVIWLAPDDTTAGATRCSSAPTSTRLPNSRGSPSKSVAPVSVSRAPASCSVEPLPARSTPSTSSTFAPAPSTLGADWATLQLGDVE
jgi:hypothetical protein